MLILGNLHLVDLNPTLQSVRAALNLPHLSIVSPPLPPQPGAICGIERLLPPPFKELFTSAGSPGLRWS